MFILVPIGHERTEVRRLPVVSLVILALNVVAFLLTYVREGPTLERDVGKPMAKAFDYLGEHPYLEIPDELAAKLFSPNERRGVQAEIEQLRAQYRSIRGRIPTPEAQAEEQGELERLCHVAVEALSGSYSHRFGYNPAHPRWWTLFTAMFMHGGWLHLVFNMLFFFLSGPFIEDVYGRALYSAFYLTGGVVATLVHAAKFPDSPAPLIGASGAIAGLMGAFLVRFLRTKIRFFYFFFLGLMFLFVIPFRRLIGTFWAPAYVMLPLWLGQQVMEANLSGESAGVAFWAHIGGFLFGAAAAAAVRFGHVEERFINPKIEKELGIARPFGLARGMEARAAGRFRQARFYLDQALREAPADPEVHYELFQTYNALGDRSAAARHALKHVALETKANRMDSALATFREASEHMPTLIWPAALLLALGRHAERTHDNTLALWLYQELLKRHPGDPLAARALAFTASIHQRHGDVRSAVASLARALAVPKLDPTIRLDLENRIRELCTAAGLPLPEMPPVVASSAVAAPPVHGG